MGLITSYDDFVATLPEGTDVLARMRDPLTTEVAYADDIFDQAGPDKTTKDDLILWFAKFYVAGTDGSLSEEKIKKVWVYQYSPYGQEYPKRLGFLFWFAKVFHREFEFDNIEVATKEGQLREMNNSFAYIAANIFEEYKEVIVSKVKEILGLWLTKKLI